MGADPAPLLVDRRKAAKLLGVSPGTIDNLRIRGEIQSVKIGARRLYDVADLRWFIDEKKRVATLATAPRVGAPAPATAGRPEGGEP